MTTVFKIEPNNGESYGFPIEIPEDRISDVKGFLLENGYPEVEYGSPVFCYRLWEEEVVEEEPTPSKKNK
jgi:hypothetical protein